VKVKQTIINPEALKFLPKYASYTPEQLAAESTRLETIRRSAEFFKTNKGINF
jgi:hypothetical protein